MSTKQQIMNKTVGSRQRASYRYTKMIERCKHRPHYKDIKVLVSREEFIVWFMERDFEGASVDRINNRGHYEFFNMQVIHHSINCVKDKIGVPSPKRKGMDGNKKCQICKLVRPLGDYHKKRSSWNGYGYSCKVCISLRLRNST